MHLNSILSKVHCFKFYYGPGLAYTFYFIMHEVMCTHLKNVLDHINQCSEFNRNVQQGEFIAFGGGWGGRESSEDNYLLYMKTHFF